MSNQIATTIAAQIGNRAFAMMGAKNLLASERALQFKIGRNAKGVTHVTVTLDPTDTYTVKFDRVRKYVAKPVAEVEGVYVDSLRSVIESNTGLYLSL
jgi:hypothetical protein